MEILECFWKAIQTVGDQPQQMDRLGMMGMNLERLPIGLLSLDQATGLLMTASLLEPRMDGRFVSCVS
jgi:hypothetical protein